MILITGTPRSGTHYTAALLQQLGKKVLHEALDEDGTVSWKHIGEGTFEVPKRNRISQIYDPGFTVMLHQVRHPLKVVSSMQTLRDCSWEFMARHIELDMDAHPVKRGMQAWVGWNQKISERADWRFKIEELSQVYSEFAARLSLPQGELPQLPHESRESRTHRYEALDWAHLRGCDADWAVRVADLAERYGYDTQGWRNAPAKQPPPISQRGMKKVRSLIHSMLKR